MSNESKQQNVKNMNQPKINNIKGNKDLFPYYFSSHFEVWKPSFTHFQKSYFKFNMRVSKCGIFGKQSLICEKHYWINKWASHSQTERNIHKQKRHHLSSLFNKLKSLQPASSLKKKTKKNFVPLTGFVNEFHAKERRFQWFSGVSKCLLLCLENSISSTTA